jgi:hypothetical protein
MNPVSLSDPTGLRPECGDCTRAAEQKGIDEWASHSAEHPVPVPSASALYASLRNPEISDATRYVAARLLVRYYGQTGLEIVENSFEGQRLAEEASTWYQVTHHAYSSWQAGPDAPKYIGGAMVVISLGTIACVAGGCAALAGAASAGAAKVTQLANRVSAAGQGTAATAQRVASTPFGRIVQDFRSNPASWTLQSAHAELSTRYSGGISIEYVFTKAGSRMVQHVIYVGGDLVHETFRSVAKFGA